MLEVILDTETTGLSTADNHKIVEVECVELNNQIPTNNTFHEYINPQRAVSEDAYKVHGYSNKFLSDKKIFSDSDMLINRNYVIGHSHQQFQTKNNNFLLVNPGSVGQNRKNLNIISFCEFDTSQKSFIFHNLEYDSTVVTKKMIDIKYPDICVNYYKKIQS